VNFQTQSLQDFGNPLLCPVFLKTQFRMHVKIPPQFGKIQISPRHMHSHCLQGQANLIIPT
jgi:hypothetical protein